MAAAAARVAQACLPGAGSISSAATGSIRNTWRRSTPRTREVPHLTKETEPTTTPPSPEEHGGPGPGDEEPRGGHQTGRDVVRRGERGLQRTRRVRSSGRAPISDTDRPVTPAAASRAPTVQPRPAASAAADQLWLRAEPITITANPPRSMRDINVARRSGTSVSRGPECARRCPRREDAPRWRGCARASSRSTRRSV